VVHDADVRAGTAAPQAFRVDTGPFKQLPGRLEKQAVLGIHRQCFARADPEEFRVELGGVVQEATFPHVGLPRLVRVRVVEKLGIPAAIRREFRDRVRSLANQLP
jgi:hypothetical protein